MKLELKENMYVRTKDGYISQYKYYDTTNAYMRKLLCIPLNNGTFANIEDIIKASYNIIDILEVGDAIEIDVIDKDNYPTIMGINFARIDNKVELASIKDMLKNESAKLLTVITHEQIEQMAYKVGD